METLYLNEILRILFFSYQKSPKQFTSLFNDSKSIAAFDFDISKKEFVGISKSFNTILGINIYLCELKEIILNEIIHPSDLPEFREYFTLSPFSLSNKNTSFVFKRMKCRLKHSNGSWKYFLLISFNQIKQNPKYAHKIGFIIEEMTVPGFIPIGTGDTHLISEASNGANNQLHITKRENEILEYISQGMIAKEIASKLNISVTTVISHRKNLINKFHVRNTAELVREASRLMIV